MKDFMLLNTNLRGIYDAYPNGDSCSANGFVLCPIQEGRHQMIDNKPVYEIAAQLDMVQEDYNHEEREFNWNEESARISQIKIKINNLETLHSKFVEEINALIEDAFNKLD